MTSSSMSVRRLLAGFIVLSFLFTSTCHGIGTAPGFNKDEGVDSSEEEKLDPATMPYFDYSVPRNVSCVVGQHAFLLCRVHRMKDKSVSWIRKRDLHILTAGIYTYTTDQRFVVIHADKSENWTLQIKYPQERDAGVYECQVNTEPKISMAFHLSVIESKARIVGGSEVFVQSGSSLKITCEVEHGPHELSQVFWYRGPHIIDPKGVFGDNDIKIVTQHREFLQSNLTIPKVRLSHSGNYTCSPTMAVPASVFVHVVQADNPAAMQHGNGSPSSHRCLRPLHLLLLLTLLRLLLQRFLSCSTSLNSFPSSKTIFNEHYSPSQTSTELISSSCHNTFSRPLQKSNLRISVRTR